jgi:hypothetical protein
MERRILLPNTRGNNAGPVVPRTPTREARHIIEAARCSRLGHDAGARVVRRRRGWRVAAHECHGEEKPPHLAIIPLRRQPAEGRCDRLSPRPLPGGTGGGAVPSAAAANFFSSSSSRWTICSTPVTRLF